jgi:hypothetical protein
MRIAAALALVLVLTGCGGGSEPDAGASPKPRPTTASTGTPTAAAPEGKPVPEALSRFRCTEDDRGTWRASGYLANTAKSPATFQVTVYIGPAAGGTEQGKTRQVPSVAPGGSVKWRINALPAPDDGGPCHVQVLLTH